FIALIEQHGIPYHEKTDGQLFCDRSSKDVVAMLQDECAAVQVDIRTDCHSTVVGYQNDYCLNTNVGQFTSESLVVATGGLSIPKMGASDFGYRLARQFDVNVLDTRAGLVPFTFTGTMHDMTEKLSGVSFAASISVNDTCFTESLLFTHRGLSGPAALQASSYWHPGDPLEVDILPTLDIAATLREAKASRGKAILRSVLAGFLPRSLIVELQALLWVEFSDTPIGDIADKALDGIAERLERWILRPAATEGYRTAEVTLGGVDTRELSSKTMEVRRQPGLYFIGEVVDVTGHLGGFNFQWAWASAQAAGQHV
ncbi:MAG: NAD(P)/FAD-dependent oxidoreductase, partial [Gammaproteobacteria bacterium]|nr:NAD(P)/FAD-dependent oxidoreductase [Gammaproteobacteria bacterium]